MLRTVAATRTTLRVFPRSHVHVAIRDMSAPAWATVDPDTVSGASPHRMMNLVGGEWTSTSEYETIVDPLNGEAFIEAPLTRESEFEPFVSSLRSVPKSGLHNPLKNPDRYQYLGDVSFRMAAEMRKPEVHDFFVRLVQRVVGKSTAQCDGEVVVTRRFLENFGQDNVRRLAEAFAVPGDHTGQQSVGYRWPFGPVAIVTPFNFPIEIPLLQLMGALYMGNKPLVKVDSKVAVVMEQCLRMMHDCGLDTSDVDFVNADGPTTEALLVASKPANTLFTGSSKIANKLCNTLNGRVKLEDAGFDWKILGPDATEDYADYVAWQADHDAYGYSGQKCSAQSILFMHENWAKIGFVDRITKLAARRNLGDMTIGPVLTWTTEAILAHVDKVLEIPGAKLLFGGKALEGHSIPECYGAVEPTAVFVPMDKVLSEEYFDLVTTELFGPFQIVTEYDGSEGSSGIGGVLEACERMEAHLTAGVATNDWQFAQKVLGHTVNGTTYSGIRARTTGAPQNHWFGPAGDARAAGIGTAEAIKLVWSTHREIVSDIGPVPGDWTTPPAS